MVRSPTVVVAVLLVAMAGCSAVGASPDAPSPSPQPPDAPTRTATDTPSSAANGTGSFPPGASTSGIENATRLVHAHRTVLNDTPHAERSAWEEVGYEQDPNGTFRGFAVHQYDVTVETDANGSRMHIAGENETQDHWFTDDGFFRSNSQRDGNVSSTSYEYSHNHPYLQAYDQYLLVFPSLLLEPYLRDLEYEHVGTVTRDNRTLHRYASTGINGTVEPNIGDTPVESTTEDITATVVVSERGVIRSFTARETHAHRNETTTVEQRYAVDGLGETNATAPAWVTEEIAKFDVSLAGNETVLAITHAGGRTATDPTLFLNVPDDSHSTRVNGTIAAGDTVYVYLTTAGSDNRTLHTSVDEPPAVNDSFVDLGDGSLSVTVWRYLLDSHDTGIRLEATIDERPADAGNATAGPPAEAGGPRRP